MAHVLSLNSSVSGEASVSRELVAYTLKKISEGEPTSTFTHRDLGANPVPHLLPETVAGVKAVAGTEAEKAAAALSDELIRELMAADVLVIGAPMYNFSISTGLRTWIDHIVRARVTFSYTESGPKGLVTGKRAIVLESRGGIYEGPNVAIDFQEPYLKHVLSVIGIADIAFVRAEGVGLGPDGRSTAIASAHTQIDAAVGHLIEKAA